MDQPDSMTVSRRGALLGAGAVGAGVALAACGGKTAEAPPADKQAETSAGGAITVSQVPVGGGLILKDAGVVITQPQAGQFHAFSAVCPHKSCTVNAVADGTIDCPCHGSKFSVIDGAVVEGPATAPLPARTVTVSGDALTVS